MILKETKLWSADNSGAVRTKCIHIYNPNPNQLGNFTKSVLRGFDTKKKLLKKKKYINLIITVKQKHNRLNGNFIKFSENRAILMADYAKFLGSRIHGPIAKELQSKLSEQQFKKLRASSSGAI